MQSQEPSNSVLHALTSTSILWAMTVAVLVLVVPKYVAPRKSLVPLPPGPRPWPILGNAPQIQFHKEWLVYMDWIKKYGHIISLTSFGQTIVILNSSEVAIDLLQKRSSIYSDRPVLPFAGEMVGWNLGMGLTRYGEYFRQMRRLSHQALGPRLIQNFWLVEEREAAKFLDRLLQTPENFIGHIRHKVGAVVLKITHGYTVLEDGNDPLLELAEKSMEGFARAITPGAWWVDYFSPLRYIPSWMPGADFRRKGMEWRNDLLLAAETAHNFTKGQMEKGIAIPSFTSQLLEGKYTADEEYLVKWTAFSLYAGGADTSVAAITTFFLAMCLYPDVQIAAQAELDTIVGTDRLPNMNDRPSLPYIEAVVKEVFRWGPIAPMGIPHRLIQEDFYEGYRLPAGTVVIPNIWAMTHNPDLFPRPEEFRPERFVGPNQAGANPLELVFGFGRRVCPGQHLAETSVFLAIAMTLATFTISKSRDKQSGEIIEPEAAWVPRSICHPVPFPCEIKPRSAHSVSLIKNAVVTGNRE